MDIGTVVVVAVSWMALYGSVGGVVVEDGVHNDT